MRELSLIEHSIITTYRKSIWSKFLEAINQYHLLEDGDKIAVAISGGKDSLLLAKLFQEYEKHGNKKIQVFYICMDPGFTPENRNLLEQNCKELKIPVQIKKSNVFEVAEKMSKEKPCFMCARMRRGFLYDFAKECGCNKMALGHHFDDVIETTMLNILYGASFKTMCPKIPADNFDQMILIRPMFLIKEYDIKRYNRYNEITPMTCGCKVSTLSIDSKRKEVKEMISEMKKTNKNVDISIFRSAENVYLQSVLGYYKTQEERVEFDQIYQERIIENSSSKE